MKEVPIRKFTTVVGYLTEAVAITNDGRTIGVYTPLGRVAGEVIGTIDLGPNVTQEQVEQLREAMTVDDVKKAIEPEKVKVERPKAPDAPAKLSKGLGDIPGRLPIEDSFGTSRPAPKPGKGK